MVQIDITINYLQNMYLILDFLLGLFIAANSSIAKPIEEKLKILRNVILLLQSNMDNNRLCYEPFNL